MNRILKTSLSLFMISGCSLLNIISTNTVAPVKADDCTQKLNNSVIKWSISKIKASSIAYPNIHSCWEVKKMNKMSEEKILITSGRDRGKATICLSDEKKNPCKFKIGFIDQNFNSTAALSEIYSISPPRPTVLNETVERLFIKPYSLLE